MANPKFPGNALIFLAFVCHHQERSIAVNFVEKQARRK
jgi:hypothetical protein